MARVATRCVPLRTGCLSARGFLGVSGHRYASRGAARLVGPKGNHRWCFTCRAWWRSGFCGLLPGSFSPIPIRPHARRRLYPSRLRIHLDIVLCGGMGIHVSDPGGCLRSWKCFLGDSMHRHSPSRKRQTGSRRSYRAGNPVNDAVLITLGGRGTVTVHPFVERGQLGSCAARAFRR